MRSSKILVGLTITVLLSVLVGCGGGFKRSADWGPDDVKNSPHFNTGSIQLELECCEKENYAFIGDVWVGSGIVENKTNHGLFNLKFTIEVIGKDGLTLPDADTERIDLDVGEKARVVFGLLNESTTSGIRYGDVKGAGTVWVSYD